MIARLNRTATIVLGVAALAAITGYAFRWVIGGRAITIVDPIVRAWASDEVGRLSDGAYRLTATPIRVTAPEQRLAIDTITLVTDSARNAARDTPLPTITARYFNCAVEGIDLERLARRRGLSVDRAGCDSVQVQIAVPLGVARDTAGGSFLSLQEDLDLGRGIPFIAVDSVVFPHVVMALSIASSTGPGTAVSFDRLAVRFDHLHYDPDDKPAERRTLLSRNVTLAVDSLHTRREGTDQTDLDRLRVDLADGTVLLTGLRWHPVGGALTDSLGLVELAVDSLDVAGINWRDFLTRGDAAIRRIHLAGARLAVQQPEPDGANPADSIRRGAPWTLGGSLAALDRRLQLDTLIADAVVLHHLQGDADTITSEVGHLMLHTLRTDPADRRTTSQPIGPMVLQLRDVHRTAPDRLLDVAAIRLDLGAGTARIDSLRFAPPGSDADFIRRHRRRADRIAVTFDSLDLSGLDAAAWVHLAAYQAHTLRLWGLSLDVLSDKRLPAGRPAHHLTPQQWMQRVAPPLAIDSLDLTGTVQYRERSATAPRPGVLRFTDVHVVMNDLRNIRAPGRDTPTRVAITSRLMGAAPFRLTASMPLLDDAFTMTYAGELGPIAADALNPFLDGALGARFTGGRVRRIAFDATVQDGVARGRVIPRYEGLWVEVPGVARSGFLSGLKRAIAKFAANQFVIREDNLAGAAAPPRDGTIAHRWQPRETLIQFLWNGVRDGLLQVVRK
jgi:hypothetical protein